MTAQAILACTLLFACGPKPPPEDPSGGDGKTGDQKPSDTATQIAEQQQREYIVEEFTKLITQVNEAIDALDAEALYGLMTPETQEMFSTLAQMDMFVAGIKNVAPPDHVVQQQKDFNVVYTLEDIDTDEDKATLVGVMRDSGNEVRFPITFVPQGEGDYLFDYTEVLGKRVKNMTKVILGQLITKLDKAIKAQDLATFETVFAPGTLAGCPTPFGMGDVEDDSAASLKAMHDANLVVAEPQVNTPDLTGTVPFTAGDVSGTVQVTLVLEGGQAYMDATMGCIPPPNK